MTTMYRTVQGDTWDIIAFRMYGTGNVMTELMNANPDHIGIGIFNASVTITIPEIDTSIQTAKPPWMKG